MGRVEWTALMREVCRVTPPSSAAAGERALVRDCSAEPNARQRHYAPRDRRVRGQDEHDPPRTSRPIIMKFWNLLAFTEDEQLIEAAQFSEALGFDAVGVSDHLFIPEKIES